MHWSPPQFPFIAPTYLLSLRIYDNRIEKEIQIAPFLHYPLVLISIATSTSPAL